MSKMSMARGPRQTSSWASWKPTSSASGSSWPKAAQASQKPSKSPGPWPLALGPRRLPRCSQATEAFKSKTRNSMTTNDVIFSCHLCVCVCLLSRLLLLTCSLPASANLSFGLMRLSGRPRVKGAASLTRRSETRSFYAVSIHVCLAS